MLLSRHRDAEILSYAAYHLGFDFVRGSTNRGGVAALRELLAKSRHMHLTITPDGPRGPRRQLAPGCVYLGLETGAAAGGDGLRLRSPVAGARRLGPVCHPASALAGPEPCRAPRSSSRPTSIATELEHFRAEDRAAS